LGGDDRLRGQHADLFQEEKMVLMSARPICLFRLLLDCAALLLLVPGAVNLLAQEAGTTTAPPNFPEFSQVAPYTTSLQQDASSVRSLLATQSPLGRLQERLVATTERLRTIVDKMTELGAVEDWYSERVLDFDEQLRLQHKALEGVQNDLTAELQRFEALRQGWEGRRSYLRDWLTYLREQKSKLPLEVFQQALRTTEEVLGEIDRAQAPLLALQQRVATVLATAQQESAKLDAALSEVRNGVFRKNSHSFFEPEFYRQFKPELLNEIKQGIEDAKILRIDFFRQFGWLIGLQLLLALILSLSIHRFHHRTAQPDEWAFLLRHPWATGIFVAVSSLSGFYQGPPQLFRFLLYAFGVGSVAILIASIALSRRRSRVVLFLAILFLLSTALRMISLPLPIYRIYLLVLYLVGAPLLWWISIRARQARGRVTNFVIALRLGSVLLAAALVAQVAGYVNFSFGLVQASIETLFAYLFLLMALKLGFGAIDFLLGLQWLKERLFIRQHGRQLKQRLKKFFRLVCSVYALFFLSEVWGLFDTVAEAWDSLLGWSLAVGETRLSLRMVLLAGITLYLTYQLSWFLQASIDTQLLQRRQVDRGVRDAIKKLLHYALVLIGFLLAIGALGFQLQHLVVVAGAFGVGIGFGLQDIVNNFLSGLILLFERPVKVGDGIIVDGDYGTVVKIGLRSTVVETLDQAELIVPNSQIISQKVTNWTLSTRRVRLVVPVGVAYGSDVGLVMEILAAAGNEHADVLDDPAPSPIFTGFGDSSLDFELRAWIANVDNRPRVKSDLLLYIDRRFRETGVEIPFPQRDLHLRSVDGKVVNTLRQSPAPDEAGD
jgi:potassium-dependent mechanosensitive channel